MKPNNSLPIKLEPVKVLQRGDVFLWKSGMTGKYEIHTFHSDTGYGAKTFTDYNEQDGSSLLVNYSGVCGVLSCDENQAEDFWKKKLEQAEFERREIVKKRGW